MTYKPQSAAVLIKPKHQSAPKAHWMDKVIQGAAQELDAGTFVPPSEGKAELNKLSIATFHGADPARIGTPHEKDFERTHILNNISEHPAVLEALERFKTEIEDTRDDEELLEKTYALHELQEKMGERNRWDGQERWQGKDNEEMRKGELLSPATFFDRLVKVIGEGRIFRGNYVETNAAEHGGVAAICIPNPKWNGEKPQELPFAQARRMKEEAETEMATIKGLRKLNRNLEADRRAAKVQEKLMNAGGLMMEGVAKLQGAEKEFIRVAKLQYPTNTEWMIMGFDEFGVPTQPRFLGWRTALLLLVKRRIITEEEAHKAFPVGSGPASSWYLEQLQKFRNTGIALVN